MPLSNGACGATRRPSNAFRVGVGRSGRLHCRPATPTLPQPLYPGVNGVAAGAGEALDPNFRPNHVDTFTLTFARQLNNKLKHGDWLHRADHQQRVSPDQPQRCSLHDDQGRPDLCQGLCQYVIGYCGNGNVKNLGGGNCVGNAAAVAPQPFFEAALSGTGYCNGFANCTQAVIANEGVNGTGNLAIANRLESV